MGTRERPADRGRRRAREALRRLGREHRDARVSAGLSLRACAAASGASYPQLRRFERGEIERLNIADVGAWFAVVGLDLGIRAFPGGDPIRDRAQLAVLERLRVRLHPSLRWRTEVPLPIENDLRAWDAEIRGEDPPWRTRIEAETRISDGQALERRLALKLRDDPDGHLILLVADTRTNRRALAALRPGLRAMFPCSARDVLAALGAGRESPGSAILVM
jgi:transcriptional regulator with XRE-family HTH domain